MYDETGKSTEDDVTGVGRLEVRQRWTDCDEVDRKLINRDKVK